VELQQPRNVGVALVGHSGAFGQTGSEYFRTCWERRAAALKAGFDGIGRRFGASVRLGGLLVFGFLIARPEEQRHDPQDAEAAHDAGEAVDARQNAGRRRGLIGIGWRCPVYGPLQLAD
jgi:hypothetical protein